MLRFAGATEIGCETAPASNVKPNGKQNADYRITVFPVSVHSKHYNV